MREDGGTEREKKVKRERMEGWKEKGRERKRGRERMREKMERERERREGDCAAAAAAGVQVKNSWVCIYFVCPGVAAFKSTHPSTDQDRLCSCSQDGITVIDHHCYYYCQLLH